MLKRIAFALLTLFISATAFAQDNGANPHMAFYGVEPDSLHNKNDSIFRLDSSHVNIYICGGMSVNSPLQNLSTDPFYYPNPGEHTFASYIRTKAQPGATLTFGFEYLSKEYKNHMMFSIGLEVFYATMTGTIHSNIVTHYNAASGKDSAVNGMADLPYNISVFAIDVPVKAYYVLSERRKHRLSMGLGLSIGDYILGNGFLTGYVNNNNTSPLNTATASIKYDIGIGGKTGLSFEPCFSMQIFDNFNHPIFAGIKIASL